MYIVRMASRATKITIRVIGGVVAVVLVAVLAVIAWALFRPLLQGDYNHTYGYIRPVAVLSENPLSAMVSTVGTPTSASKEDELNNRIANTLGQIEIIREDVTEAQDSRAGSRDEELSAELDKLGDAYDNLTATFESWQSDGYAAIGATAKACAGSQEECQQAALTIERLSPQDDILAQLHQAVIEAANTGSTVELDSALIEFADHTETLWDAVEDSLSSVTDMLAEHGAEVDE